ncbi:myo-inosose-2 dehydratase [Halobacillus karajensis]|uniref:Inosose dehydratase n=1 Tax=Halobacillus karajensis TaxID=195088 RepID=A0A024P4S4_9BACI|nr:myo-inosose-2 dehydratase [Halobacillus karajensis]CDQ20772.1 Inosose dehydratase [Halobacillus karajensis]CDQ23758.1 Inosose dehydratase [Halobacillus karajensis]CDQ27236.1 Inosose dehydratase [Halobacillus karajensis]
MFKDQTVKLGICPIGWTNDDMPELGSWNTFEQCVSEMALAGYEGTEVGNKYPKDRQELKKALELRQMQIASAWFSSFLTTLPFKETEEAFIKHRDFLYEMGAKVIVVSEQGRSIQKEDVPLFEAKPHFTEEEWELLAEGLNLLGELAHEKGMEIVFHHHMGTGVQTKEEIDKLMNITDEDKVSLLFDTGHLYLSGEDPLEVLKLHLPRIKHVHLKDVRGDVAAQVRQQKTAFLDGVKEGMFTVPGNGDIEFGPIFETLANFDYRGWVLVEAEQDPAKANPLEQAIIARNYIRETAKI